jgi:predicted acetyltransferase
LFCFFDNPYYYPPEKAAHQMNISVEEYDKVKNELYERFGTRERQARPNSVTNLDAILDSQLKEETGIINPWNRIWESLE